MALNYAVRRPDFAQTGHKHSKSFIIRWNIDGIIEWINCYVLTASRKNAVGTGIAGFETAPGSARPLSRGDLNARSYRPAA